MCKSLVGKTKHKGWKKTASASTCMQNDFLEQTKKVFQIKPLVTEAFFLLKHTVREACIRSFLNNKKLTINN